MFTRLKQTIKDLRTVWSNNSEPDINEIYEEPTYVELPPDCTGHNINVFHEDKYSNLFVLSDDSVRLHCVKYFDLSATAFLVKLKNSAIKSVTPSTHENLTYLYTEALTKGYAGVRVVVELIIKKRMEQKDAETIN